MKINKKINIKILAFMLAFLMILSIATVPQKAFAMEGLSENILNLSEEELLITLENNGLILPPDYAEHRDMAESFAYRYTKLILEEYILYVDGKEYT